MSSRKGPLRPIGWPPDARFRDLRRVGAGETKPSLSSALARPTGNDTALQPSHTMAPPVRFRPGEWHRARLVRSKGCSGIFPRGKGSHRRSLWFRSGADRRAPCRICAAGGGGEGGTRRDGASAPAGDDRTQGHHPELHLERTVWALRRAVESEHQRAGRGGDQIARDGHRAW
jgi:hypothetical protein